MSRIIAKTSMADIKRAADDPQRPPKQRDALAADPRIVLESSAILLDVDGTLLDIAPTPHEVRVPSALPGVLLGLSERVDGALAFISGRSIADIDRIFHPLKLPAVGGHGAEIRPAPDSHSYRERSAPLGDKLKARFSEIAQARSRHHRRGQGLFAGDPLSPRAAARRRGA